MLTEIKVIPTTQSPRKTSKRNKKWEREDKALLDLWPDSSPSPPHTPKRLETSKSTSKSSSKSKSTSKKRCGARPPRKKRSDWKPSKAVQRRYAKLLATPQQRAQQKKGKRRKSTSVTQLRSRPTTQDPSFDRSHWRRSTRLQIFDKNVSKWVEGTICKVERARNKSAALDSLHILYKPAKKTKGAWVWKDHKPVATKRGRLRRVSAIKEDEPSESDKFEWEASVILRRNSRRLRPAIRVVWDPDLQSYLHEEPEECSSSDEEPEEYSSGEEAEQFWTNFQTWQGPGSESSQGHSMGGTQSLRSNGETSRTSYSKNPTTPSRQTITSRHTQETLRSNTQATTMNTNYESMASQGCSSTLTYQGFPCDEEPEEEPTESDSEEEPIL